MSFKICCDICKSEDVQIVANTNFDIEIECLNCDNYYSGVVYTNKESPLVNGVVTSIIDNPNKSGSKVNLQGGLNS